MIWGSWSKMALQHWAWQLSSLSRGLLGVYDQWQALYQWPELPTHLIPLCP